MKDHSKNVEEVTEFAKDLTWEKHSTALADQLYVLGNQNRRQYRLQDQVDWCITDSPLLLGVQYVTPDYLPVNFKNLLFELWSTYENHNFFIRRTKPYSPIGRNQTEQEARQIDENIIRMLTENGVPFSEILATPDLHQKIFEHIFINTQRS